MLDHPALPFGNLPVTAQRVILGYTWGEAKFYSRTIYPRRKQDHDLNCHDNDRFYGDYRSHCQFTGLDQYLYAFDAIGSKRVGRD
jgi:hypothetical protein